MKIRFDEGFYMNHIVDVFEPTKSYGCTMYLRLWITAKINR